MPPRYAFLRHDSTGSTQDDALAAFRGSPVLVTAGRQTRGRGRAGRRWETAPRGVAASLAVRPPWPPSRWGVIPLVAGLAAREVLGERVGLKWPNDLVVEGAKVGGILAESLSPAGEDEGLLVVGMGLNLWWPEPPEGVGALHREDPGPEAGHELAGRWADRLLERLDGAPEEWGREEYRRTCLTVGRRIRWEPDGEGQAVDVDQEGRLVVDTPEGRVALTSSEVREVRSGPGP